MNSQVDVARTYLDALLSHDGGSVPYMPDAIRYEVGLKTGFSANHLRRSLSRGPQYRVIQAIRDVDWSVDGDHVTAVYLLDAGLFGKKLATVKVTETFHIPASDLRIHRIDAGIRRA